MAFERPGGALPIRHLKIVVGISPSHGGNCTLHRYLTLEVKGRPGMVRDCQSWQQQYRYQQHLHDDILQRLSWGVIATIWPTVASIYCPHGIF